jgi:hypothetical protein
MRGMKKGTTESTNEEEGEKKEEGCAEKGKGWGWRKWCDNDVDEGERVMLRLNTARDDAAGADTASAVTSKSVSTGEAFAAVRRKRWESQY